MFNFRRNFLATGPIHISKKNFKSGSASRPSSLKKTNSPHLGK